MNQHTTPRGRSFETSAYGNDATEIELCALDEARKIFGPDAHLEVERDYQVGTALGPGEAAQGKSYYAHVHINVIE
jgi:hypothetical protein